MSARHESPITHVLHQESDPGGEDRRVLMRLEADGTLRVREETSGALTEAVFGCSHHCHEVSLPPQSVRALELAHGSRPAAVVLGDLFRSGVAYLTDLLDEFDGMAIGYAYVSLLPSGDAYFRPEACQAGRRDTPAEA